MRFTYLLYIAATIAITLSSCKSKGDKYIDQGEIHFNIDYKGTFAYPTEVLPHDLIVSFKNNKILFEMTGLGSSGIINLSNPQTGIFDTYYNFMGVQKYYYAGKPGEIFPGFEAMNSINIKKTSRTQQICGYDCKNAEVTFANDRNKIYNIWYTDQIQVENPNASTPFSQINGVLLSFFFIMGSSELHFMAQTVYNKELPDEIFERKPHYVRVSKTDIVELMDDMMETDKK
ncbi:MAG: hypothetical protein ACM3UT_02710 [Chloroflexota bacterium]